MYHSAINLILKHQNRTKTIIIEQFDSIIKNFYRRPLFGQFEKILLTNKLENQKQIWISIICWPLRTSTVFSLLAFHERFWSPPLYALALWVIVVTMTPGKLCSSNNDNTSEAASKEWQKIASFCCITVSS